MRIFVGDKGIFKFSLLSDDGQTQIDLTGFVVTWNFFKRDGTIPIGNPFIGDVTDAVAGEVEFDLPATISAEVTRYSTIITITNAQEIKSSAGIISLDVDSLVC